MAELTYRAAVTRAIAQEMQRDETVYFIGEDVAAAGGVFKATPGLLELFGPTSVRDTPISEEAIIGLVMGAEMTGLRPVAEIMFSDFFATCWDIVANQIAKTRYMTNGQISLPLVIRSGNGGGLRFGAQHSQSVENWAMAIPGLKVVAPSTAEDVIGLFAAAVRDPDPVIFLEHKALYPAKFEVPEGEIVGELGRPAWFVRVLTSPWSPWPLWCPRRRELPRSWRLVGYPRRSSTSEALSRWTSRQSWNLSARPPGW